MSSPVILCTLQWSLLGSRSSAGSVCMPIPWLCWLPRAHSHTVAWRALSTGNSWFHPPWGRPGGQSQWMTTSGWAQTPEVLLQDGKTLGDTKLCRTHGIRQRPDFSWSPIFAQCLPLSYPASLTCPFWEHNCNELLAQQTASDFASRNLSNIFHFSFLVCVTIWNPRFVYLLV